MEQQHKLFAFLLLLWSSTGLLAQLQIEPQVIASAGTQQIAGDLKVDWTLGELAIYSLGDDLQITQGMHQGEYVLINAVIQPSWNFSVAVYPNPTAGALRIETDTAAEVQIILSDLKGRLLEQSSFQQQGQLYLGRYPAGAYLLRLISEGQQRYTTIIHKF